MNRSPPSRRLGWGAPWSAAFVAALCTAAGCAQAPHRTGSDAQALAACRARADEIYAKQNRGAVYDSDVFSTSVRDSPFSTQDVPSLPTRGLSGEYQRDNLVNDCLAGTGAASTVPAAPSPFAPPPPPSPTP